jgi:putative DNA primase/helicase
MKDKDDNSGGSAGDEKNPPGEDPDDLSSVYRGREFNGKRGGDPKADANGEHPPWYGIEVSMVNSANETETNSVTIGSVLDDTRNGRWKVPIGRIREKYLSELAKAVGKGSLNPAKDAKAKCPEFVDVLLNSAMEEEDVDLLVRWSGSVLLGLNYAQRFMILEGTAGGGKGTVVEILEALVGEENSAQIRMTLLEERFEVGRYVGKTLLAGKDVAGNFLEERGASVIKSLVGHDKLTGEIKGSMETPTVKGIFGMVITCNSRLRVRLDGDVEAWRRRMLLIRYERPKPERRIAGYSEKLLEKEAEGILVLFVKGAMRHLKELSELGDFRINAKQQGRVDALLLESDSLRHFARERICEAEDGVLPTADIVGAYFDFCREEDWSPLSLGRIYRELPSVMMELFRSNLGSHGQNEKGERLRGYPKVALRRGGYTPADIQL